VSVAPDLRVRFHRDLAAVDAQICLMFELLQASLADATRALTSGDVAAALEVVRRDGAIDEIDHELEASIIRILHLQSPVAGDLRYLVTVLRVAPELERSADLAEHIAAKAAQGLGASLTPELGRHVRGMGDLAEQMWAIAAEAWCSGRTTAVATLELLDVQLDEMHDDLTDQLHRGALPLGPAVEMALVSRFYERLGDHAVNVTERLSYAAGD